jgi:hypothetical protein
MPGDRINFRGLRERYAEYKWMKFHREQTGRFPIESACDALQDRVSELESAAYRRRITLPTCPQRCEG